MTKDIAPDLLKAVQDDFKEKVKRNAKVKEALKAMKSEEATFEDANHFAEAIGDTLAESFKNNIKPELLPNERMYYNIAERVVGESLKNNYNLVSGYSADVQTLLNRKANLHINGIKPPYNTDKAKGIINRISSEEKYENISWILQEPVTNFTQSVVDDTIKTNADFHYKAGLKPKIVRKSTGHCCGWCEEVAGEYKYPNVPKDVYRRHRFCRCTVEYDPGDGRRQNVRSKKWQDIDKDEKIQERVKFSKIFTGASGAKNYFRDTQFDDYLSDEQIRKEKHAFLMYDSIKNSNQKVTKRKIFNNIKKFEKMKNFTKEDVDIAFDHVFNDLHDLEKGQMLFEPDYEMAQSWNRLINNNDIQENDLILLKHERLEHDLMYKKGLSYNEAHDETSKVYFYNPMRKENE